MNDSNETNLLYGCNGEIGHIGSEAEAIVMALALFIIIIISLFGNGLVISAIYNFESLREFPYAFLCSLAISDLLSPIARLLPIAISNFSNSWIFGCTLCSISCAAGNFFSASSIVHLVFITIERFLCLRFPLKYAEWLTKRFVTVSITFIWSLSLLMAILPVLDGDIEYRFNRNIFSCDIYLYKKPSLGVAKLGIYFGIPLILMILVYSQVFRVATIQASKISYNSVGDRKYKRKKIFQQHWKAARVVFAIVGIFFVLWSPYFIATAIKAYCPTSCVPDWFERAAFCCAYVNSCCNWIVYSVMNKTMRSSFLRLLRLKNVEIPKLNCCNWRRKSAVGVSGSVPELQTRRSHIAVLPAENANVDNSTRVTMHRHDDNDPSSE